MEKKYKHIALFLISCLFLSLTLKGEQISTAPNRMSFGVKIGLMPTGNLTEYALVYYRNNVLASIQSVSLERLIKIGQGVWPVPKTVSFFNYFEEYGLHNDTLADGSILDYEAAFDSLWKIRFTEHPFDQKAGKGWSLGDAKPSLKQQKYIYDRYGVRGYDQDYFVDSSFFKLLKDVMNEAWIQEYKSLYD
ncbi:MAG: hypothetical protein WC994_06220 [Brumimicrobium sp.]